MNPNSILTIVVITIVAWSCNKDYLPSHETNKPMNTVRKVRYELYTNENFSGNRDNVQFKLYMKNSRKPIFDSLLAPMKIEDIPDSLHRIIIEKFVPGNDTSSLAVGFIYNIEGVGISSHLDRFPAGDTLKVVRYPFQ